MGSKNHLSMQLIDVVTTYTYVVTGLRYVFGVPKESKYQIPKHKLATYIVYCLVNDDLKQLVECGTIDLVDPPVQGIHRELYVYVYMHVMAHSKHTVLIDGFRDGRYELKILDEIGSIQNYLISSILDTKLSISKLHSIQKNYIHMSYGCLILSCTLRCANNVSCKSIWLDIVFEMIC